MRVCDKKGCNGECKIYFGVYGGDWCTTHFQEIQRILEDFKQNDRSVK